MSLACASIAFAGFAPTYFLRGLSDLPPLSVRAHVHGAIFTAWMLLFIVQAALVRADRRDLHRLLGTIGTVLAVLMIWVAASATLDVLARFEVSGFRPAGLAPVEFLARQLGMLLQFATLVALAIALRRRPDVHKRLMVLATISILPPAIARFHLQNHGIGGAYTSTLIAYSLVVAAAAFDFAHMRRVHAVYIWGGLAMLTWMFARAAIGKSDWWQPIGHWLIG
jgi:hypothetical protein